MYLGCTSWDVPCLLSLRADFANQSNANMFRGETYSLRSWVFWSLGANCQLQLVLSFPSPHTLLAFGKRCSGISRPTWGFVTHIKLLVFWDMIHIHKEENQQLLHTFLHIHLAHRADFINCAPLNSGNNMVTIFKVTVLHFKNQYEFCRCCGSRKSFYGFTHTQKLEEYFPELCSMWPKQNGLTYY